MSNNLIGALLLLMWVGFACLLGWRVMTAVWRAHCPRITTLGKAGTVALILICAAAGADKTPAIRALATMITVLQGGSMIDPSGRIASIAATAAVREVADSAAAMASAASNTVADAQQQFDAAAATLTNRNLTVAYLAADLPRALPGTHTNHNLAATIQRVRQDGATNLVAWVWYSEEPAIEPQVAISYSVAAGVWRYLPSLTNSYPATTDIDGIPCIEYRYEIPAAVRGVAFRPDYELAFGGAAGEGLTVPPGGVMIQTNGFDCLPYSGTDNYSADLAVTYRGGIAVAATYHGTNYTGVVTL